MSDSISDFYEDIEEYRFLCEMYREEMQYKETRNGLVVDIYGKHATQLKEKSLRDTLPYDVWLRLYYNRYHEEALRLDRKWEEERLILPS